MNLSWRSIWASLLLVTQAGAAERLIDTYRGDQDATIYGYGPTQQTGRAMVVGDFNGDGIGDLAFSLLGDGPGGTRTDAGEIQIIFGGPRLQGPRVIDASPGDVVIYGANPTDEIGLTLAAGDVNGDGIADLISANPFMDLRGLPDPGSVFVWFGRRTWPSRIDLATTPPDVQILGSYPSDKWFAAVAGDVTGDGIADLTIGSSTTLGLGGGRNASGEVHVFFGPLAPGVIDLGTRKGDLVVYGANANDQLLPATHFGDIDGDGKTDLVLIAQGFSRTIGNVGAIFAFLGPVSGGVLDLATVVPDVQILSDEDWRIAYPAVIGDLNQDGAGDLVMSGASGVQVVYGGAGVRGVRDLALSPADVKIKVPGTGRPLLIADATGDGRQDLIVDSWLSSRTVPPLIASAGIAQIVDGSCALPSGLDLGYQEAAVRIEGSDLLGRAGFAVASGDLDGDGLADLFLSAPFADGLDNTVPGDTGEIYVIYGRPRALLSFDLHRGSDPASPSLHIAGAAAPVDEPPGTLVDGNDYYYNLAGAAGGGAILAANRQRHDNTVRLSWADPDRCTAIPVSPTRSSVTASEVCLAADDVSTATITVVPSDDFGDVLGTGLTTAIDAVAIFPGVLVGEIRDDFVGTYTQDVRAPDLGTGRLVATAEGVRIDSGNVIQFVRSVPAPDFSWPAPARAGVPVDFTDLTAGGTAPYAYAWDFESDGVTDSALPNPSHVYPQPGTFDVTLAITDSLGCPAFRRQQVLVAP